MSNFVRDLRDKGAAPAPVEKGWPKTLAKSVPAVLAAAATIATPIHAMLDQWPYVGLVLSVVVPLALLVFSVHVFTSKSNAREAGAGFGREATVREHYRFSTVERHAAKASALLATMIFAVQLMWNAPRPSQLVEGYACRGSDKKALQRVSVEVFDGTGRPIGQAPTDDNGYFRAPMPGWAMPAVNVRVPACDDHVTPLTYAFGTSLGCLADEDESNEGRYGKQVAWSFSCPPKPAGP